MRDFIQNLIMKQVRQLWLPICILASSLTDLFIVQYLDNVEIAYFRGQRGQTKHTFSME